MKKRAGLLVIMICFCMTSFSQQAVITLHIIGEVKDTVQCVLMNNNTRREFTFIPVAVHNGEGAAIVPIQHPFFFTISDGVNYLKGLIEPGDSLQVYYTMQDPQASLQFSGKGKEKSQLLKRIHAIKTSSAKKLEEARSAASPLEYFYAYQDSIRNNLRTDISRQREWMTKKAAELLKAETEGNILVQKYFSIGQLLQDSYANAVANKKNSAVLQKQLNKLLQFNGSMFHSDLYINQVYIVVRAFIEEKDTINDIGSRYKYIQSLLPNSLQPAVLTHFLLQDIRSRNYDAVRKVMHIVKDTLYKKYITQQLLKAQQLKEGDKAPDFSLEDEQGNPVTLASLKGKTIYLDFWFAACIPCQELFLQTDEVKKELAADTSIVFLNISIDEKEVWHKAIATGKIRGRHVYTNNKARNHAVISTYNVQGYPTNLIIDKNGRIHTIDPPHHPAALKTILLQALAVSTTE